MPEHLSFERLDALAVEPMERELEAIMTFCNLRLRWRVPGGDDPKESFERVSA